MASSYTENRNHKRYNVHDFVVAVFADRIGQIINISESGLAMHLIDNDLESLPEKCKTFFVSKDRGFLTDDLFIRLVRKKIMLPPNISLVAVQFDTTDAKQLFTIREYISGLP